MINAGKTTLGQDLAEKLNYKFIDSDTRIVNSECCSINNIFKDNGEMYFRKLEKKLLHQIINDSRDVANVVIATGGGMPCFFDNMDFMNNNGITIFLDVIIPEIIKRLSNEGNKQKPLLQGYKKKDLFNLLTKLRSKRLKYYSSAQIKLCGDSISCKDIIDELERNNISDLQSKTASQT